MSDLEYTQKMREYNLLVSTKEYLLDETDKEAQAAIADAYLMYKQVVSEQKRKVAYARKVLNITKQRRRQFINNHKHERREQQDTTTGSARADTRLPEGR
jgi:tRNA uridine 5-carbamoylmethylation protein Kti12